MIKITHTGSGDGLTPATDSKSPIKKHNAHLPRKVVESILTMAALGAAPFEIIEGIKEEYAITITPQQVAYYNPDNISSKDLKPEYKEFFYKVKRDFIESLEKIPMAHAATRIKRLDDIYNKATKRGDLKAATNAVKEARIEMDKFKEVDIPDSPLAASDAKGN